MGRERGSFQILAVHVPKGANAARRLCGLEHCHFQTGVRGGGFAGCRTASWSPVRERAETAGTKDSQTEGDRQEALLWNETHALGS